MGRKLRCVIKNSIQLYKQNLNFFSSQTNFSKLREGKPLTQRSIPDKKLFFSQAYILRVWLTISLHMYVSIRTLCISNINPTCTVVLHTVHKAHEGIFQAASSHTGTVHKLTMRAYKTITCREEFFFTRMYVSQLRLQYSQIFSSDNFANDSLSKNRNQAGCKYLQLESPARYFCCVGYPMVFKLKRWFIEILLNKSKTW